MLVCLTLIGSFLLGSIPTAYLLVKMLRRKDIRRLGSGNVGTMNVRGQMGTKAALVVLLADATKGAAIVWLCRTTGTDPYIGLALGVAGHIYPPWLGFRGGKGLAAALGGMLALKQIPIIVVFCLPWLPVYFLFLGKDSDKANLTAIIAVLFYTVLTGLNWGILILAVLIADKHRRVIKAGTDNRP